MDIDVPSLMQKVMSKNILRFPTLVEFCSDLPHSGISEQNTKNSKFLANKGIPGQFKEKQNYD